MSGRVFHSFAVIKVLNGRHGQILGGLLSSDCTRWNRRIRPFADTPNQFTPPPYMSLSFEELADAGLSATSPKPKSKARLRRACLLLTFVLTATGCCIYYLNLYKLTPELHESLEHLIVVDATVSDDVMPHQYDDATEFEDALKRHKEHYKEPQYRATPLAAKAVPALPAPEEHYIKRVEKESKAHQFSQWWDGSVLKVKSLLPHTDEAFEAEKEPVQVANATLFPFSKSPPAAVEFAVTPAPEKVVVDVDSADAAKSVRVVELSEDAEVKLDLVRDWEGLILVPEGVQLARAYTSGVRLNRVEAHPIDGGRLRVWSRIENLTNKDLVIETACEFRFTDDGRAPSQFRPSVIPASGALDVYFVSSRKGVNAYTLMVKR